MNITGTETIDTEDGKLEVECDADSITLTTWERIGDFSFAHATSVRMTWAEWTAVNRAVETFAAALNRKNAA